MCNLRYRETRATGINRQLSSSELSGGSSIDCLRAGGRKAVVDGTTLVGCCKLPAGLRQSKFNPCDEGVNHECLMHVAWLFRHLEHVCAIAGLQEVLNVL